MTATFSPTQQATWATAIAQPAEEFPLTPLPILSGQIPSGLRGTLYRNGPGRLTRGHQRVGHWFDGDGAILAVHFTEAGATGTYRYVQTAGYLAEEQADQFLYGNYGRAVTGPIWRRWLKFLSGDGLKNVANTSVLALPDKLLALWEAGLPHTLDLQTLETLGLDHLGSLASTQPYSAHPLRDPLTGEIFSIGVDPKGNLYLYRSDRSGQVVQQAVIKLESAPLLHSFALAGPYLIFFLPPLDLQAQGLPVLLGLKSYCDALQWHPNQSTKVLVVDRDTFTVVSCSEAEPWFQWHFGNGCVEADGTVKLDFVKFPDFMQTNEYLREFPTGQPRTHTRGTLWQVRLNPQTGKILDQQEVVDRGCEFPLVPPQQVGQAWRYTYLAMHRPGQQAAHEWFGAIGRFDYQTECLTESNFDQTYYPVEPIYVADALNADQGWVLTVMYDSRTHTSEVWIWHSDRMDEEPVCRLGLPSVIPFGFHGTWQPAP
jgi:all-trans-8'-apo-beta-carotenal 15,15'-oxygenase